MRRLGHPGLLAVLAAALLTGSCDRSTPMQPRTCTDACAAGATACDSTGAQVRCLEPATLAECRAWSAPEACGRRSLCVAGACTCLSPCQPGESVCADDAHEQRCTGPDAEGCYSWGDAAACAAGVQCVGGSCGCASPCQLGATACGPTGELLTCVGPDGSGCYSWSATACGTRRRCVAGMCVCENECLPNQVGCDPIQPALVTCDGPDENGCLFWGAPVFCEVGQVCKSEVGPFDVPACADYTPPFCTTNDLNECDFVGQKVCMSDTLYRECFVRAEDGCLRLDCGS